MRTWIVIGFMVVALAVAGRARRSAEPASPARRLPEVAAPARSIEREPEEPPPPRSSEATTPSLPLFEVGPEDDEVPPARPEPAAEPSLTPPVVEVKPPVFKLTPAPLTEARIERYRSFVRVMLNLEMSALNQCYEEAQRRYPRLRRDVRLNLTLSGARHMSTSLESVELDVTGYLPAQFDSCVKRVVNDISLPSVPGRLTLSLPFSIRGEPAEIAADDDDEDDDQGDA